MPCTRLTRLLSVAVLTLVVLAVSQATPRAHAEAANRYGAIAYSQSTGKYGYSHGQYSRSDAESVALGNCEPADAKIVVWVRNGWAALALGDKTGAYGWGWSDSSLAEARANALANAGKRTTNVYIAAWVYTGD